MKDIFARWRGQRRLFGVAIKSFPSWWPRGRYNGQPVVGLALKVVFDVSFFGFRLPGPYGAAGQLGPFRFWLFLSYRENEGL